MDRIKTIFLRGLITLLPIALTIYILYFGVAIFENFLGGVIKSFIPAQDYIPGLGFLLTIILIFLFGLLLNNLILQTVLRKLEEKMKSIPFFKAVYSPLRDLIHLFSDSSGKALKSVVLVRWGAHGPASIGLITRDTFEEFPDLAHQDLVAVFIPLSYALGGNTLLFRKQDVTPVDIPVEKALQLAITAWVKADHHEHDHSSVTPAKGKGL
jgi:uncharacterized membrane protein